MSEQTLATGAHTAEHLDATERWAAHNYHPLPVVLATGEGAWVTDVDGNRYLDCLSGYSALNFGHSHPRLVVAAIRRVPQARVALPQRRTSRKSLSSR